MATKKQKREAALAKRQALMEDLRLSGLEAQRKDREKRAAKRERNQADAERLNRRHQAILQNSRLKGT